MSNLEDHQFSVVVCASGGGGNFQAIIDAQEDLNFTVSLLIVDRECGAIARAASNGIPWIKLDLSGDSIKKFDDFQSAIPSRTNLIVLAGFMPILPAFFCNQWKNKIINTHPSLLPKYGGKGMYGVKVQEAVMLSQDKIAGCTVHFVNEKVDGGEILLQKTILINKEDTPWSLGGRIFKEEGPLLVQAIKIIKNGLAIQE